MEAVNYLRRHIVERVVQMRDLPLIEYVVRSIANEEHEYSHQGKDQPA